MQLDYSDWLTKKGWLKRNFTGILCPKKPIWITIDKSTPAPLKKVLRDKGEDKIPEIKEIKAQKAKFC